MVFDGFECPYRVCSAYRTVRVITGVAVRVVMGDTEDSGMINFGFTVRMDFSYGRFEASGYRWMSY